MLIRIVERRDRRGRMVEQIECGCATEAQRVADMLRRMYPHQTVVILFGNAWAPARG